MAKYRLLNQQGYNPCTYEKGEIYDSEDVLGAVKVQSLANDFPGDWELIKEEPMCIEKKIIGYKLIKPEYEKVAELILGVQFNKQMPGLVTVDKCIADLKKAGVLDLWFKPVYEKSHPDITINGYKGEFLSNSVKFGCAEINKQLFLELYAVKDSTWTNGREIESITIGKGTFTKDHIKEIAEYYLNK